MGSEGFLWPSSLCDHSQEEDDLCPPTRFRTQPFNHWTSEPCLKKSTVESPHAPVCWMYQPLENQKTQQLFSCRTSKKPLPFSLHPQILVKTLSGSSPESVGETLREMDFLRYGTQKNVGASDSRVGGTSNKRERGEIQRWIF